MRFSPKATAIALSMAVVCLASAVMASVAAYPCDPPNVLPRAVCGMDAFTGAPPRQVPVGWTPFVLSGDLTFMRDEDSTSPPSLRMWSDGGTFTAGIYTRGQVAAGAGYRASIEWAAPYPADSETFGRRLGVDPTGGVDPRAKTVIWGPVHWAPGRIMNYPPGQGPNLDVKARAVGDSMTVFVLVEHPASTGNNLIFIDTVALYPDESAPHFTSYLPAVRRAK